VPPRSPEQNYTDNNETGKSNDVEFEQYLDIERGDVDLTQQNANNASASPVQQTQVSPQQSNSPDPVQIVQNMISAGFTPTRAQISNANAYLGGPADSSNTWFALFLQRLLKLRKIKGTK
jgi:hypothetical protein